MGNAAMRKAHRVENPAQDDMLTNIESDQSESMDSLVRLIFLYTYLLRYLSRTQFQREIFAKYFYSIIEQT